MKKTILILLVLALTFAAYAVSLRSIGIETGRGVMLSGDLLIKDNMDTYVRFGYDGDFNASAGFQYKATTLEAVYDTIEVLPGIQISAGIGETVKLSAFVTCTFRVGEEGWISAFVRPGMGVSLNWGDWKPSFAWVVETGIALPVD